MKNHSFNLLFSCSIFRISYMRNYKLFLVSVEWESRSLWHGHVHVPHGLKIKVIFFVAYLLSCYTLHTWKKYIYCKKSPTSWHWNENKRQQQHLEFLTSRLWLAFEGLLGIRACRIIFFVLYILLSIFIDRLFFVFCTLNPQLPAINGWQKLLTL